MAGAFVPKRDEHFQKSLQGRRRSRILNEERAHFGRWVAPRARRHTDVPKGNAWKWAS